MVGQIMGQRGVDLRYLVFQPPHIVLGQGETGLGQLVLQQLVLLF
jgi:hypothetical protein